MLQKSKFFILLGVLILLLAACGTSNSQVNSNETNKNTEQTPGTTDQSNESGEQKANNEKENDPNKTSDNEQSTKTAELNGQKQTTEQTISYTLNGESKQETAKLTKSDNQNFSLYVLPKFELTAEEPYKDLLFLSENDAISMRIEILPADTDLESLKNDTLTQLKVVNENVQTLDPPNDEFLQNATIMESSNNNGEVVTAYLLDQKDSVIKLTLFTKNQSDYRDAFIQMAKTIQIAE
jgi:hypothetical protein